MLFRNQLCKYDNAGETNSDTFADASLLLEKTRIILENTVFLCYNVVEKYIRPELRGAEDENKKRDRAAV